MTLLLNGEQEYVEDTPDPMQELRDEVESLRGQLADAQNDLNSIKSILRGQFAAFSRAFGDSPVPVSGSPAEDKWQAIKQRLAPRLKECVDILLIQGPMKRTQIASAMRMGYDNCVKNVIQILLRQGLLMESNGNITLKPL